LNHLMRLAPRRNFIVKSRVIYATVRRECVIWVLTDRIVRPSCGNVLFYGN
jgi:hypothetical protein